MYVTKIPDWSKADEALEKYTRKMPLGWGYIDRAASGDYPADAFSKGQLLSKAWLLHEYKTYTMSRMRSAPRSVALLGCWVGAIAEPLLNTDIMIDHLWGFDVDQKSVDMSNHFNKKFVDSNWRYKAVCEDVNAIDWDSPQFEVEGQLIETRPDLIINTSAEHMAPDWFHSVGSRQLVILQTNNNPDLPGHDYTVGSETELRAMFPMNETLFMGAMEMPSYTRYMMIGYK